MVRLIAIELVLLLAPWAIWWAWHRGGRRIEDAPHVKLAVAGVILVLVGLVPEMQRHMPADGGRYVPATTKDGVFIPDHFEP